MCSMVQLHNVNPEKLTLFEESVSSPHVKTAVLKLSEVKIGDNFKLKWNKSAESVTTKS